MVTAETAVVLPFLVAVALALVCVTSVAITQVRLVDAAREGARMVARGDDRDDVVTAVEGMAPEGAVVAVEPAADGTTRVTVDYAAGFDVPLLRQIPPLELSARAASLDETTGTEEGR